MSVMQNFTFFTNKCFDIWKQKIQILKVAVILSLELTKTKISREPGVANLVKFSSRRK